MNSGFEELLNIFNRHEVRYLIVGGHAVMLYTEPRYTKDLDLWVEGSAQNAARVFQSLAEFGLRAAISTSTTPSFWSSTRQSFASDPVAVFSLLCLPEGHECL